MTRAPDSPLEPPRSDWLLCTAIACHMLPAKRAWQEPWLLTAALRRCGQAAELGQWGLARALFEHGLRGSPRHTPMAERLAEVLLQLGDYQAAAAVVLHLLRLDACHPRARQLAAFLAAHGVELPEAARRCLPGAHLACRLPLESIRFADLTCPDQCGRFEHS